jgi:AraC-like DNA-binding protein
VRRERPHVREAVGADALRVQATGTSFKQWLLAQRLAHARWMLETGDAAIEVVAREAGFGSALSLRQHFRAALQTSPAAYRKAFRRVGSSTDRGSAVETLALPTR